MTLTEFLLARLDEDEEIAREATNDGHRWLVEEETISLWPDDLEPASGNIHFPRKAHAYHAATWEPARVLAEVEAKRRILSAHPAAKIMGYDEQLGCCDGCDGAPDWPCATVAALALPYANHPDYRQEWRA